MPVLKFRNFLSASRKPNMVAFGMYRSGAVSDLDVIEDNSAISLPVTGSQDGSNTEFTIPGPLGSLYVNGARQAPIWDYNVTPTGFSLVRPPIFTDIILVFSTSIS